MGTNDLDELQLPRERKTDPAPPETLQQQVENMQEQLAAVAAKVNDIHAETAGLTKAFHTVNGHLSALRADSYMATEQLRPLGVLVGELEARITGLEARIRSMSLRPGEQP